MQITIREARAEDREPVLAVEAKATRNLKYLAEVFDLFLNDGNFYVAEIDGEVVACGKFTVMPDGSAWLEALRVIPERQGLGIGKRFYERFFATARDKGITVMRMYTGVRNAVSKGLAERFGFHLAATYRGASLPYTRNAVDRQHFFQQVTDPDRATELIIPFRDRSTGFVVMNRTFYAITPALCAAFAREGKVYADPASGSVIVLGARFMASHGLHIALFGGDEQACLAFAQCQAFEQGISRLQCMFPPSAQEVQNTLVEQGWTIEESDCIVMGVRLS